MRYLLRRKWHQFVLWLLESHLREARNSVLSSVVASLVDYPHVGGDLRIMREVDRLVSEAKDSIVFKIDSNKVKGLKWSSEVKGLEWYSDGHRIVTGIGNRVLIEVGVPNNVPKEGTR